MLGDLSSECGVSYYHVTTLLPAILRASPWLLFTKLLAKLNTN